MEQNYQTIDAAVTAMAVPEAVSVALGEIVAEKRTVLGAEVYRSLLADLLPERWRAFVLLETLPRCGG